MLGNTEQFLDPCIPVDRLNGKANQARPQSNTVGGQQDILAGQQCILSRTACPG